jgi:hypothetical protein
VTGRFARRVGRLLVTVSIPRFREHRLRTGVTISGIALGIATLVAVALVNRSILDSVHATIDDVAGKADLQLTAGASGFDEALAEVVRAVPGVHRAAVVLEQTVTTRDPRARGERLLVLGVDFLNADDDYFRTYGSKEMAALERDSFAFLNSPYNLVLSGSVARRLGYRLHDRIALQTPSGKHDFEITGRKDDGLRGMPGRNRRLDRRRPPRLRDGPCAALLRQRRPDRLVLAVSSIVARHPRSDAPRVDRRDTGGLVSGAPRRAPPCFGSSRLRVSAVAQR